MPIPLLAAHDLSYQLAGRSLIHEVTFSVEAGEFLAVVGPNGAGKSTLLGLLAGDLTPTSGMVRLDGHPLGSLDAHGQALRRAVLRQQVSIAFPFTTLEVALMGRHPHLRGRAESAADDAIARDALARTEMLHFAERVFPTLSGGEQARASLARVLAQQAPLLLLDEPTAALDLRHQHVALQIAKVVSASGGAVVAVLHDLNLAALYADRIALLHQGRLLALGSPWSVLDASRLSAVYGVAVSVRRHPHYDAPLVLALPSDSVKFREVTHAAVAP